MVSVNLILRDNLITKAQSAKEEYELAAQKEALALDKFEEEVNKHIPTIDEDDGAQWLCLEIDGDFMVFYNGNAKSLTLNSSTVKAEISKLDGSTINKTGEINEINLNDYYVFLCNVESIIGDEESIGPEIINLNGKKTSNNLRWPQNVKEIKGLDGWTETGKEEFQGLKNLERIELPTSLIRMGQENFVGCISLESIVLPDSIVYMDHSTFRNCTNLKNVTLPKGELTRIPGSTFQNCTSLTMIEIPSNIGEIDSWAFDGCINLKTIRVNRTLADAEATLGTSWIPSGATVTYNDQSKTY